MTPSIFRCCQMTLKIWRVFNVSNLKYWRNEIMQLSYPPWRWLSWLEEHSDWFWWFLQFWRWGSWDLISFAEKFLCIWDTLTLVVVLLLCQHGRAGLWRWGRCCRRWRWQYSGRHLQLRSGAGRYTFNDGMKIPIKT